MPVSNYEALLRAHTVASSELSAPADASKIRCLACAHHCLIAPGNCGICKVRFNHNGTLHVPFGYVAGMQSDPIEKKPFFHFLPGTSALSFGMLGCNFHCSFCQNWISSQVLRDPDSAAGITEVSASAVVDAAVRGGDKSVVSTYNEPLITTEWAIEIFRNAKARGLRCGYVSNGHASPEVIELLTPHIDAFKVDLKCYDEKIYRQMGGNLGAVLDTIRRLAAAGIWVEIVTLVVPGMNDDEDQLRSMAKFIASVSPDIPWHVTAFYPTYKMRDRSSTKVAQLLAAAKAGRKERLHYVYAGNIPGAVDDQENTFCGACKQLLIQRRGYYVIANKVTGEGRCPQCGVSVPGIWA